MAKTRLILGNFRGRGLAALVQERADTIRSVADIYTVALAAGWRRQAVDQALDVLVGPGVDGLRLVDDDRGQPQIVRERGA